MTKKNKTWLAVTTTENGKNYAYAVSVSGGQNIFGVLSSIPGITAANICTSKKDAEQLAKFWNECFKNNGTWLYSHEEATA